MSTPYRHKPTQRIAIALICGALAILYFFVDPVSARWMPQCVFHHVTGLQCPGCGSQRALHALLHGHLAEAFSQNALLVVLGPVLLCMMWLEWRRERHPKLYAAIHRPAVILVISAVIVAWGVIRNLV